MEVVLLDKFMVPEESKAAFLTEVRKSSAFLWTLPGFVEGFVYESTDGGSRPNVVTTAVWKNDEACENARKRAAEEFQRIGFKPPEIMRKLKVEMERGIYRRSAY